MTEKSIREDGSVAGTGQPEKRRYEAPSLVRYGSLFVETGMTTATCSQGTDKTADPCDPDGGADM